MVGDSIQFKLLSTSSDVRNLRVLSVAYFIYLLLFSGLEYSLTFLVHQRFQYTRLERADELPTLHTVFIRIKRMQIK